MNHVYRIVFNHSLGVYQCVSELAKSRGKSSGKSQVANKLLLTPIAIAMIGLSGTASAVTYNNGQTTTISDEIYFAGYDTVTGNNTVLAVNNFFLNNDNPVSTLLITKNGEVSVSGITLITNDAEADVTQLGLFDTDELAIGYEGNGTLSVTSGGRVISSDIELGLETTNSQGTLNITGENTLVSTDEIEVGKEGSGTLNLSQGGSLTADSSIFAGYGANSKGNINVNNGSVTANNLIIGDAGDGKLTINEGRVEVANNVNIAQKRGSKGDVTVDGSNSILSAKTVVVGLEGDGTLTVSNGGIVDATTNDANDVGAVFISSVSSGKGLVNITDKGSKILTNEMIVGNNAGNNGTLNITKGAEVEVNKVMRVANDFSSTGTVNINDGSLSIPDLTVGYGGNGTLTAKKAKINADQLILGHQIRGQGNVTLDEGSDLQNTKGLAIGRQGTGTLTLKDKSNLTSKAVLVAGSEFNSVGNLIAQGQSSLQLDEIIIGDEGTGNLNIESGSSVTVDKNTILGRKTFSEASVVIDGVDSVLNSNGEYLSIADNGKANVTVRNKGKINANTTVIGNNLGSTGILTVSGDGTEITSDNIVVGGAGRGTLNINNGGTVKTGSISSLTGRSNSTVNFNGGILELSEVQPQLFQGFTSASKINLGTGGGTIDTAGFNTRLFEDTTLAGSGAVITGAGDFTKAGTGLLAMATTAKQWTGATNISQGTLRLDGNYTMRDGEVLGIGLNTLDDYGQLVVQGRANISQGQLEVNASEAVANLSGNNEWKDIVKATTRVGKFTKVSDNSPLVSFYADYSDPNAVHLKMGATTPPVVTPPVVTPPVVTPPVVTPPVVTPPVVTPPVADTTFVESVNGQSQRNDVGIAYALDRSIQDQLVNGDNDLAKALIGSTTNFNQVQLAVAANQLQPLFMGATNRIITDTNYAASEAVTEHRATTTERNVWAKLIGNTSSHYAENGVTGYEADSYGAIVGLDTPINSSLNLGVAVSYIDTDADTDGGRLDHKLTTKNWQVLGYGNYAASDATHVNFHAGAGSSAVKGERHLSILTDAIARSDYDVDTLRAGLGVDHRIGSEQRHVTPFAQVNYAQAKSDSYRETGAGVYNLNVDENRYESMRWTAGLKMSQYLTPQFAITGQLAAAIENGDQHSDITANFVGMPNDSFTTIGQEVGREIGIVGIGVSYMPTLKTTLSAGYRSEWRENYDDQGASIALQTTF